MAFGMNDRKGAFGEVEAIKSSKVRIKRDQTLVIIGFFALIVGITIMIIFGDLTTQLFFYIPIAYFSDSPYNAYGVLDPDKKIFLDGYPIFFTFLSILMYCIFCINSKKVYKAKSGFWLWFGKPFHWFSTIALNNLIQLPNDLEPKIGFDAGWFEKLDKDFFNQIVAQQDGYKRAKELKIFYDMPYFFGATAHKNIKRLFISDESYKDLLVILEGYLQNGLYDELWIEDNDIVTQAYAKNRGLDIPKGKIYENFKAYSIRQGYQKIKSIATGKEEDMLVDMDSVVLSRNAIKIFLQNHSINFYNMITTQTFKDKNFEFRPIPIKLLSALQNDISFTVKVKKYYSEEDANIFCDLLNKNPLELIQNDKCKSMLVEMLMADFMFIVFRMVLERYMGIPAGLLVSKIADYDTRMILETYQRRVLVKIVPTKNDGSTAIYNSDNYTNLFIFLLSQYFDNEEANFFQELKEKFNTDIHETPKKEVV